MNRSTSDGRSFWHRRRKFQLPAYTVTALTATFLAVCLLQRPPEFRHGLRGPPTRKAAPLQRLPSWHQLSGLLLSRRRCLLFSPRLPDLHMWRRIAAHRVLTTSVSFLIQRSIRPIRTLDIIPKQIGLLRPLASGQPPYLHPRYIPTILTHVMRLFGANRRRRPSYSDTVAFHNSV